MSSLSSAPLLRASKQIGDGHCLIHRKINIQLNIVIENNPLSNPLTVPGESPNAKEAYGNIKTTKVHW